MTDKEIEEVALEVSKNCFHPILRSMISRTEATTVGAELYKSGYNKGREHTEENLQETKRFFTFDHMLATKAKIAELEGKLKLAVEALEKCDCDCCDGRDHEGKIHLSNISTCLRCKALDKIREGENG